MQLELKDVVTMLAIAIASVRALINVINTIKATISAEEKASTLGQKIQAAADGLEAIATDLESAVEAE